MDLSKVSRHRRRASVGSQTLLQSDFNFEDLYSPHNFLVEHVVPTLESHGRIPSRHSAGGKNCLNELHDGLTTSKELLKVLSHVWHIKENHLTSLSLISSLKLELERAYIHVNQLIQEQRTNGSEINMLLSQFEEENTTWKIKERDRIHSVLTTVAGELEIEKKRRRQMERLNKKLGQELTETKSSLTRAIEEIEMEKRARETLERVCDELTRSIGEDKVKVEEPKRQSVKVCEEVEKEREMLQLSDVLNEERVQMKLLEAKYEFEEKNAIIDELKSELESYLKSKTGTDTDEVESPSSCEKIKQLKRYLMETLPNTHAYQDNEKENIDPVNKVNLGEEYDLVDSDLLSFELNVNDISKCFEGSNAIKNEQRKSVHKFKGRTSIYEDIKKPNISSDTRISDGIDLEFTSMQENSDPFNLRELLKFFSQPWNENNDHGSERYNMT